MSSHYKWYPSTEEVVVPWNAQYEFPSQANKAIKITPRIPPKNGAVFTPGSQIRLEFPAQGYVNTANTTIEFDVTLTGPLEPAAYDTTWACYFENNIQSIFNRVRILYGSTPLEDIINNNYLVRHLTEFTAHEGSILGPSSVTEGIGGACINTLSPNALALVNARQTLIQGITATFAGGVTTYAHVPNATGAGTASWSCTRRYQIQLVAGLFQQGKLLPVKYMASQLAIELTLESVSNCVILQCSAFNQPTGVSNVTYSVSNVNLIPEILEFDSSYDQQFLQGLVSGGVPIQFSSWHHFQTSLNNSSTLQMIIQERSRSLKAVFGFMRLQTPSLGDDAGSSFGDQVAPTNAAAPKLLSYQFRIGGRYFPASPVIVSNSACNDTNGNTVGSSGSTEAFIELQKALNCLGDYRIKQNVNTLNWNFPACVSGFTLPAQPTTTGSGDYFEDFTTLAADGKPLGEFIPINASRATAQPSSIFCFSTSLETSNGKEISGLNAEEQSDISLIVNWNRPGTIPMSMEVFTYYDALMVLRENNVVELIQ
jgi:hypothetical protein